MPSPFLRFVREIAPVILVFFAFLALAYADGAFGIARNDDWVYARSAFELAHTGRFYPFTSMAFALGQSGYGALIVAVFGESVIALQVSTIVLAFIGIVTTFAVLRTFLPLWATNLVSLTLVGGPLFANLSVSFMTDLPTYTFGMLSLWFGILALREAETRTLLFFIVSLLIGTFAFTIREFAVAIPLGVAVTYLLRKWRDQRRFLFVPPAVVLIWLAVLVGLYLWRRGLGDSVPTEIAANVPTAFNAFSQAIFTVAFMLTPVALAISPVRVFQALGIGTRVLWALASTALLVAWIRLQRGSDVFLGNYIDITGPFREALQSPPPALFHPTFWIFLEAIALASSLILVGVLLAGLRDWVMRIRDQKSAAISTLTLLLGLVSVLYAGILFGAVLLLQSPAYDRYLLLFIPLIGGLALAGGIQAGLLFQQRAPAYVALAVLTAFSWYLSSMSFAFDRLKWDAAQTTGNELGIAPASIDGGYEWVGMHRDGIARPNGNDPNGKYPFWIYAFPSAPVCVTAHHITYLEANPNLDDSRRFDTTSALGVPLSIGLVSGPDELSLCAGAQ